MCWSDSSGEGWVERDEEVVVFNTGAAQKYLEALPLDLPRLDKDGDSPDRSSYEWANGSVSDRRKLGLPPVADTPGSPSRSPC